MNKNILEIKNLSFRFNRQSDYLFKDINLELREKNIYFLTGPNGSGKTTFFRILQGLLKPAEEVSGDLVFCKSKNYSKNYIKSVQQKFELMLADQFSFQQNLKFANMSVYPGLSNLPEVLFLPDFIEKFNIDFNRPVEQLSGGQKQILSLLMACQAMPSILLLDEPTAALDPKNSAAAMNFLTNLVKTQKITILAICHDRELARKFSTADCYLEIIPESGKITFRNFKNIY